MEALHDTCSANGERAKAGRRMSRRGRPFRKAFNRGATEGGWGPVQTWQVPRPDGHSLVFQMRLPQEMVLAEIPADVSLGAPPPGLSFGSLQTNWLIVAGALRLDLDAQPYFMGTMTVALSAGTWPPDIDDYTVRGVADDMRPLKTAPLSDKISGDGLLISRIRKIESLGTPNPVILWTAQFLHPNQWGVLAVGFASTNVEVITTDQTAVFGKMSELCYLGEKPRGW
jgi:hypothetical protein